MTCNESFFYSSRLRTKRDGNSFRGYLLSNLIEYQANLWRVPEDGIEISMYCHSTHWTQNSLEVASVSDFRCQIEEEPTQLVLSSKVSTLV